MANGYPRGWSYRPAPYSANPHISVQYELNFGKEVVVPGDKLKFKGERQTFTFVRLAHNAKLDVTWIDCLSPQGETRSFHVGKLKTVVRPKRSRRKKVNVVN